MGSEQKMSIISTGNSSLFPPSSLSLSQWVCQPVKMSLWTLIMLQPEIWREKPVAPAWRKSPYHHLLSCSSVSFFFYIELPSDIRFFTFVIVLIKQSIARRIQKDVRSHLLRPKSMLTTVVCMVKRAQWASSLAPVIFNVVLSLCAVLSAKYFCLLSAAVS